MRPDRWASAELDRGTGVRSLALLLAVVALRTVLAAIVRPMWFDEVCTALVSRMGSAQSIWAALKEGVDSNPPGYYLAESAVHHFVADDALGWRLLSIAGLLITIALTYAILARRVSRLSALTAAAFLLCTPLAEFGAEARPYALLMACVACAVAAWQRLDESPLWSFALATSLAAAISLHYYAVFVWPAFAAAELTVCLVRRHLRWGVWLAFAAGIAPLAFYAPHLAKLRSYYGQNFWSHPSFTLLFHAHDWLFNAASHWGWAFAAALTAVLVYRMITRSERLALSGRWVVRAEGIAVEELVLALALLWVPAVAVAVALLGHGGLSERYMLPTILGGALALGFVLDKMPSHGRRMVIALLLLNYAFASLPIVTGLAHGGLHAQRDAAAQEVEELAAESNAGALPIVIADGLRYLPMAYVAPPADAARIHAIADPAAAAEFSEKRADTVDRTLLVLRRHAALQVEDYAPFVAAHREFILISGEDRDIEWLPQRLAHEGYMVDLISTSLDTTIYRVSARP